MQLDGTPHPRPSVMVALATTLATNAIVENKGGRVGLLLTGYDPKTLAQFNLLGNLPVVSRHSLAGSSRQKMVEN